jgi:hypothetical protein
MYKYGPGSSVGLATGYGLDGTGIEPTTQQEDTHWTGAPNRYYIEIAYLCPRTNLENSKTYKRLLYTLIHSSLQAMSGHQQMHVEKKWPDIDWRTVWGNLSVVPVSESTKMPW